MTPARLAALTMALSLCAGCHAMHAAVIRQRVSTERFFAHDVALSLDDIDAMLAPRRFNSNRPWCELCTQTLQVLPDDTRVYCLVSREQSSCVAARQVGARAVRFAPHDGPPRAQVVWSLWNLLEPQQARIANDLSDEEVEAFAVKDEEDFTPRWSMTAGLRVGSVISFDMPSFSFGGSVGFRRWGSPYVIPGATLDVENVVLGGRSFIAAAANGRIELSVWTDDNARWWNVPRVSFIMSGGTLVGFGFVPAIGGRAMLGVQLNRLGEFPTPLFFEFGYQALEVDKQAVTGLRVAIGVGF